MKKLFLSLIASAIAISSFSLASKQSSNNEKEALPSVKRMNREVPGDDDIGVINRTPSYVFNEPTDVYQDIGDNWWQFTRLMSSEGIVNGNLWRSNDADWLLFTVYDTTTNYCFSMTTEARKFKYEIFSFEGEPGELICSSNSSTSYFTLKPASYYVKISGDPSWYESSKKTYSFKYLIYSTPEETIRISDISNNNGVLVWTPDILPNYVNNLASDKSLLLRGCEIDQGNTDQYYSYNPTEGYLDPVFVNQNPISPFNVAVNKYNYLDSVVYIWNHEDLRLLSGFFEALDIIAQNYNEPDFWERVAFRFENGLDDVGGGIVNIIIGVVKIASNEMNPIGYIQVGYGLYQVIKGLINMLTVRMPHEDKVAVERFKRHITKLKDDCHKARDNSEYAFRLPKYAFLTNESDVRFYWNSTFMTLEENPSDDIYCVRKTDLISSIQTFKDDVKWHGLTFKNSGSFEQYSDLSNFITETGYSFVMDYSTTPLSSTSAGVYTVSLDENYVVTNLSTNPENPDPEPQFEVVTKNNTTGWHSFNPSNFEETCGGHGRPGYLAVFEFKGVRSEWFDIDIDNIEVNSNVSFSRKEAYYDDSTETFTVTLETYESNPYGVFRIHYTYKVEKKLSSITFNSWPKTNFFVGDPFSYEGATVKAFYTSGDNAIIENFDIDYSNFDPNTPGSYDIHVSYTENGITQGFYYVVTVKKLQLVSISLSGNQPTHFYVDDVFSCAGLKVSACYENMTLKYVYDYVVDDTSVDMHNPGTYPVYVSYCEDGITASASYMIVVEQPAIDPSTLKSITLSGEYQTEFAYGEEFNCDGLIVTANYRIGGSEQVTDYEIETYGFDPYTPGEYPIMVFYSNGGKMVYELYLVTVGENPHKLESITLSGNYQTVFEVGDEFNYNGLIVTAHFSDGTSEIVTDYVVCDDLVDMSCVGDYPVEIEYSVDGQKRFADYLITVEEPTPVPDLVSISLSGSYRKMFSVGEQFNYAGLIVTAHYSDGSSEEVTGYTVDSSKVNTNATGSYPVDVRYNENGVNVRKRYTVRVIPPKVVEDDLESITLEGNYKTAFTIGETFNSDGLKVIAHFTDGSETLLKPKEFVVDASQVNMLRRGTYTVTVSFTFKGVTKSATYEVTVKNGKIGKGSL